LSRAKAQPRDHVTWKSVIAGPGGGQRGSDRSCSTLGGTEGTRVWRRRAGCFPGAAVPSIIAADAADDDEGPAMPIDIDHLTEAELIDLNNRIVERLRFLNQMRSHKQMLEFRIGDRVAFQPPGRPMLTGILTRYNRKTVTVVTDGGGRWNVAPGLLQSIREAGDAGEGNANAVLRRDGK
jgi:hypothetical protein